MQKVREKQKTAYHGERIICGRICRVYTKKQFEKHSLYANIVKIRENKAENTLQPEQIMIKA